MANMFAKVFSQIFDSTIAENYRVRHMFMDLLVMADSDGVVDKTPEAISRIANVPLEQIQYGLQVLAQPDQKSRTKDHDGRRIQLIDDQRDWGWRIVNFQKYRDIRDEEARRIANRSYKRQQRAKTRASAPVSISPDSQHGQPRSANTEVEVDLEVDTESKVKNKTFSRPSIEEITAYCQEQKFSVDPQEFIDYYTANGWKVGRVSMKDWKSTVRRWERHKKDKHDNHKTASQQRNERIEASIDRAISQTDDSENSYASLWKRT